MHCALPLQSHLRQIHSELKVDDSVIGRLSLVTSIVVSMEPSGQPPVACRAETDSMGSIDVPCDRYYGAQTGSPTNSDLAFFSSPDLFSLISAYIISSAINR